MIVATKITCCLRRLPNLEDKPEEQVQIWCDLFLPCMEAMIIDFKANWFPFETIRVTYFSGCIGDPRHFYSKDEGLTVRPWTHCHEQFFLRFFFFSVRSLHCTCTQSVREALCFLELCPVCVGGIVIFGPIPFLMASQSKLFIFAIRIHWCQYSVLFDKRLRALSAYIRALSTLQLKKVHIALIS